MGEASHFSKLVIQESRDEAQDARDRAIYGARSVMQVAGDHIDNIFYIAMRPVRVQAIRIVQATNGTDAGAQGLQVQRLQGTEGAGSGDNLLSATHDMKTAGANTVVTPALTATVAFLDLAVGDRLAVDRIEAATTGLTNSVVEVALIPV